MYRIAMGVEIEWGIVGRTANDRRADRDDLPSLLIRSIKRKYLYLPDASGDGVFLANGMRLYVDTGPHLEVCTPECTDPFDVVRYILAAERILTQAAHDVAAELGLREIVIFRTNVDYVTRATWGCHESYLHTTSPAEMPGHLIPHLVSRIVFSGAGGYHPRSPGLAFTLSPRAAYLQTAVSEYSTCARGIFHMGRESLAGPGHHRLHVIAGENLCSETAMCLKLGTTALVVALADAGLTPARGVELASPVDALHTFASDPLLRVTTTTTDGRSLTALDIQRHLLTRAESAAAEPFMPRWTGDICRLWRATLDALESSPRSMDRTLDWAIKRTLYEAKAERHGLPWPALPFWSHVVERLASMLDAAPEPRPKTRREPPQPGPITEARERLTPLVEWAGLDWTAFENFLKHRYALLAIDLKFGRLDRGYFQTLDGAGLLTHRQPRVGDVERAMVEPPPETRARLRGEVIRRLAAGSNQAIADWHMVADRTLGRLDLTDPFEQEERWHATQPPAVGAPPVGPGRAGTTAAALRG